MSRAYPKYRDSGVDWLGNTPSHWPIVRLRYRAELNPSKREIATRDRGEEVSFVPMEAVGEYGELDLSQSRLIEDVETGYTYFSDGDVTFAKITPCFENGKGAIMRGLLGGIGFGTTELTVLRPIAELSSSEYLFWLTATPEFRKLGEAGMYGAGGQKRVPDDFVRDFTTAFPPLSEQRAIAAFLSRETGKIDAMVEEQRKLIELLREKRQAVISHAVTKGLDPGVEKKCSGMEFLGKMPAHWTATTLRRVIKRIEQGWSPVADDRKPEGAEIGVLRLSAVKNGCFFPEECKTLSDDADAERITRSTLSEGDLLITRANTPDLVGDCAIVSGLTRQTIFSDLIYRLSVEKTRISTSFLLLFFRSAAARGQIRRDARGSSMSMAKLSHGHIMSCQVPIPPLKEQLAIVSFVTIEIDKLDRLMSDAASAIDLLLERRSALISAAVTGKIDVRGKLSETTEAA